MREGRVTAERSGAEWSKARNGPRHQQREMRFPIQRREESGGGRGVGQRVVVVAGEGDSFVAFLPSFFLQYSTFAFLVLSFIDIIL